LPLLASALVLALVATCSMAAPNVVVAEDFSTWSREELSFFLETNIPLMRTVPGRAAFIPRASSFHSYEQLVKPSGQQYEWFDQVCVLASLSLLNSLAVLMPPAATGPLSLQQPDVEATLSGRQVLLETRKPHLQSASSSCLDLLPHSH